MGKWLGDIYINLSLRLKYTILIGFIILIVITMLSFAVFEAEKYVLRDKVEDICRLSVQNLSSVAKENLVFGNAVPIQEFINNMSKLKLEGFEYAFVLDRENRIVAHSDPQKSNIIDTTFQQLWNSTRDFNVIRQPNLSEYLQKLVVNLERDGATENVPVGLVVVGYSHTMINSALRHVQLVIFAITGGIVLISIFLVHIISNRLSSNIVYLSNGVREIAKGNLDVNININSKDEIGLLATEFNKMVQSLRENLHMQKFVSRLTVDMIRQQTGVASNKKVIQKKEIAVLFSDIRGFTRLSEKLDPEQLADVINVYLNLQSKYIEENSGVIDKFAGDEIMAIFQNKDAADGAVRAAVAIQNGIVEINKQRRRDNQEFLTVGIGINYGIAVIGSMGASSRMDYTAIGDVVNLANKLCNFARSGHIVVTKNVINNLNGSFSVIKMEPVTLSGRKKPAQIYRVVY